EIVGMGFGALVESSGDIPITKISIRPLKGQADAQSLVSVTGVVFRGTRGERDSVGVVRIAANGLDASPRVVDFGNLRLGATAEKTFRIFNLNNTSTSFEIASSDSLVKTSPRSVGNLGGGRTWDVKVTYISIDPGPFSSTLLVSSIGDDPSPIAVQVKAFGTVVGVVPDALVFGDIFVGQEQTKSIIMTNPDLDPFVIDAVAFSGVDTNYVMDPAVSLPLSIEGEGGSETLTVRFNPLVRGDILDTLLITGGDTTFVIPLSGHGLERGASVSVDSLDFDTVTLGRDTTLNVVLTNTGNIIYLLDSLKIGQTDTSFSASGLTFPDTLLVGGTDTLLVRYRPDTTGAKVDTLRVFGQDTTWAIPLSGTGLPRPIDEPDLEDVVIVTFGGSIIKSRNSIHFGRVRWGVSDTAKVRVRNERGGNLTFRFSATDSQVTVKPDSVQNLPPNQEWDVVIAITPTDSIQTTSAFQITTDDIGDGITSVELISGGSNPVLSDSTINFGNVGLGLSLTKSVSVTNTGHSRLILEKMSLSEDSTFVLVDPPSLPFGIDVGASHTFQVRFSPLVRDTFADTLQLAATDTVFSVPISGIGREAKLVVAPDSIAFGLLRVGVTDTMDVVLTNDGGDSLGVDSISLVGDDTPFLLAGAATFPDTLLPNGDTRTIPIAFVPTSASSAADTLRVIAGLDTVWIPIAGTGTVASASVSVTDIDFGSPAMGRLVRDTVVVTNTGNVPFDLNDISLTDGNRWFALEDDPVDIIAVNESLLVALIFRPDSTGTQKDTLQISGKDTAFAIPLSGIGAPSLTITRSGTDLTFAPGQLDYGDLEAGQTVRRIVRIVNAGTSPLTFSTTVDDPGLSVRPSSLTALPRDKSWDLVVDWTPSESSTLLTGLHLLADSQVGIPVGRKGVFVELLTDSLAFGSLRLEKDSTTVVRLRNPGQGTFVVDQIVLAGEQGFEVVNLPSLPLVLTERDSLRIFVVFDPAVSGDAVDTLRVSNSDTSFSVPMSGRGIQPVISLDRDILDYGDLVSSTDSTLSVVIRNTGNAAFVVDSLMLSGDAQFTFVKAPVSPATLAADGGSDTISVGFSPPDLGQYSGALTFYGEEQTWEVALLGVSTATGASSTGLEVAFGPTVALSDSTLRFGDIPVGSTRNLSFTVKNNRDSSLAFSIASTDSQVSFAPKAFEGLLQAQSTDVVVSFTPVKNGATSVPFNITSNAPADGTVLLVAEKDRPPVSVSTD
ncbi:MAG: choice-of-anchor D domain-containing protein, partial [Candidatus Latescibacteria bacterium]|nr:choice-of-anchor D domain-containing protein [Candidatus Latescibacterota bacterium]